MNEHTDLICITPRAVERLRLARQQSATTAAMGLRVEIIGGSLAGFAYDLFFDERLPDDHIVASQGEELLIQPDSAAYLLGSTLDWVESDSGVGFQIRNPNELER